MPNAAHSRQPIQLLLIDLDDTLYEASELPVMCAQNIRNYMVTKLGFSEDTVQEKCSQLYLSYGTTLAGLVASGYKIDFDDWHAAVHSTLPYEQYLKPDPKLKRILDSIPCEKWIFTNADAVHTDRCLDLLGLRSCFQGIICFESVMEAAALKGVAHHGAPVICKPNRKAFELALEQAGLQLGDIPRVAFFDDSTRNITASHHMGIFSALVGRTGVDCPSSAQMRSMHDLPLHLPWLAGVGDGRPPAEKPSNHLPVSLEAEELLEESSNALQVQA